MRDMHDKTICIFDYKDAKGEQQSLEIKAASMEEVRKIADEESARLKKNGAYNFELYTITDKKKKKVS